MAPGDKGIGSFQSCCRRLERPAARYPVDATRKRESIGFTASGFVCLGLDGNPNRTSGKEGVPSQ